MSVPPLYVLEFYEAERNFTFCDELLFLLPLNLWFSVASDTNPIWIEV
jgi:hypothetical protein